jgi:nitrate reductase NapD
MSICSLVVYAKPEKMEAVCADINGREGCEVKGAQDGKIVVLMDHPSRDVMSRTIMDLNNIPGVITVSLVYEYFEDTPAEGQAAEEKTSATETLTAAGQA